MPATNAPIIETPEDPLPFKLVFSKDGAIIAETPVTSELAGRELISNLLPLLQKHEDV